MSVMAEAGQRQCPECGGKMERGLSLTPAKLKPQFWIEGTEISWWHIPNWKTRRKFVQTAYRCRNCGRLNFYANDSLE